MKILTVFFAWFVTLNAFASNLVDPITGQKLESHQLSADKELKALNPFQEIDIQYTHVGGFIENKYELANKTISETITIENDDFLGQHLQWIEHIKGYLPDVLKDEYSAPNIQQILLLANEQNISLNSFKIEPLDFRDHYLTLLYSYEYELRLNIYVDVPKRYEVRVLDINSGKWIDMRSIINPKKTDALFELVQEEVQQQVEVFIKSQENWSEAKKDSVLNESSFQKEGFLDKAFIYLSGPCLVVHYRPLHIANINIPLSALIGIPKCIDLLNNKAPLLASTQNAFEKTGLRNISDEKLNSTLPSLRRQDLTGFLNDNKELLEHKTFYITEQTLSPRYGNVTPVEVRYAHKIEKDNLPTDKGILRYYSQWLYAPEPLMENTGKSDTIITTYLSNGDKWKTTTLHYNKLGNLERKKTLTYKSQSLALVEYYYVGQKVLSVPHVFLPSSDAEPPTAQGTTYYFDDGKKTGIGQGSYHYNQNGQRVAMSDARSNIRFIGYENGNRVSESYDRHRYWTFNDVNEQGQLISSESFDGDNLYSGFYVMYNNQGLPIEIVHLTGSLHSPYKKVIYRVNYID
ncbi:MAG: hypothetical protein ACPGLV_10290 [Bacteroidia bacterium]